MINLLEKEMYNAVVKKIPQKKKTKRTASFSNNWIVVANNNCQSSRSNKKNILLDI